MFVNKRKYQRDQINKWLSSKDRISKAKLSKKLSVSRVTLNQLIKNVKKDDFIVFKREYANNKIADAIRKRIFNDTIEFLTKINMHRNETTFVPTFVTLKPYIDEENEISLRTYQNILKENNFYLPSCTRKTKKDINKRIKKLKNPPKYTEILDAIEEIIITRKYKRKFFKYGDTVEIDACEHAWYGDEKCHLYRAVDAGTGLVLVEHIEKEETSMGYIILLKKLFKLYGKPRLIVGDKRKSFWNGYENKSQISLILKELDIEIITSSDPTSKPNVERSFHDSQQWLPLELFNRKIFNMKDFNNQIDSLTKAHNQRFNKKPREINVFKEISSNEIENNLRLWLYRKVTNGNTVSIGGEHYVPIRYGQRILFKDNAKIQIFSDEKIKYFVIWNNQKVKLEVLSDKYIIDFASKEINKIAFEKRKQISFNKMLDLKKIKLEKKEKELRDLLKHINKEKEQLNAL